MNDPRYARPARWLHWSIALLVMTQLALAITLTQLHSLSFGQNVLALHQQLGLAVLVLVTARFFILRGHAPPVPAEGLPSWQHRAALVTHRMFLLILVAQPLLGMGVAWARGQAIRPLGLFTIPAPMEFSDAAHDWFMRGHITAAILLVVLVGVHIGAVAFNRVVRNVPVLERMLPPTEDSKLRNRMPIALQMAVAFALVLAVAFCACAYSVHRYRAVTTLQTGLQNGDLKALDSLRTAQTGWKELMYSASTSGEEAVAHAAELRDNALGSLDEAATLVSTADLKRLLPDVAGDIRKQTSASTPWDSKALHELDGRLQEAVDQQSAALFQIRTELDELSARGQDLIVVAMLPMLCLGVLIALVLARSMAGSIDRMRGLVRAVNDGQLDVSIAVSGRGEFSMLMREMLDMSHSLQARTAAEAARQRARDIEHAQQLQEGRERELAARAEADLREQQEHARREVLLREQQQQEAAARLEQAARDRAERERQRRELASQFEGQVAGIVSGLEDTVSDLRGTAEEMARLAGDSAQRSLQAERIAEETNSTAAEVARGAGVLSASASRMRGQAAGSREGAMTAVKEVAEAGNAIRGLVEATGQISQIAEVIADIARQTTLLSINARVEAARAGEAGRGFAIVATEVKELASRTRQATDDIEARIRHVSGAAQQSIGFLQRMGQCIEELGQSAGSILQCADEQCGATEHISERMGAITRSTGSVVAGVQAAKGTAGETEQMSAAVLAAAERMRQQTHQMQEQVANFVLEIAASHPAAAAAPVSPSLRRVAVPG